jgi:hypothetical protein
MPRISRVGLSAVTLIQLLWSSSARGQIADFIDLKVTSSMPEYCHVVRFPSGWKIRGVDSAGESISIDHAYSDYEFRVMGLLGTRFLVRAFTLQLGHRYETANAYMLDLSDATSAVLPASDQDWESAAVVPLGRKSIVPPLGMAGYDWHDYQVAFNGFKLRKSGYFWPSTYTSASRLSPDSAWVVLQSKTDGPKSLSISVYRVFFDVFRADTGSKLFTIEGSYSGYGDAEGCLEKTAWLSERYFIIPLGKRRERCLVCEFSARRRQGAKP